VAASHQVSTADWQGSWTTITLLQRLRKLLPPNLERTRSVDATEWTWSCFPVCRARIQFSAFSCLLELSPQRLLPHPTASRL